MSAISPSIASKLALLSYQSEQYKKGQEFTISPEIRKHFDFNLTDGIIQGTSGGLFWRKQTGFVLLGKGKSQQYKNDHVIAIRGTANKADGVTDISSHTTGSDSGSTVHIGFQRSFASFKPELASYLRQVKTSGSGIIHCVGHSLGGALAGLTADWIKARSEFKGKVYLYTFGAPRVGRNGFATATTGRVDKIFRCVHGADPVPKVPIWPFYHAPITGEEYLLERTQDIRLSAHSMTSGPGYVNTANHHSWDNIYDQTVPNLRKRVVLNYQNRLQTTWSAGWADKIGAAIVTLLVDGGFAATVGMLQTGGAIIGTVYDIMAKSVASIAKMSAGLQERVKGLLGCMLVYAGKGANYAIKYTEQFIRWVFNITIARIYDAARQALKQQ
ncbi:lipase family protein [Agarivorans sp. B2Z047]|uniref:lipase family protein n=1 Tax=Agarivorans sp. B2Z047 TaxID=2652721 RepID=UPI00128E501E|nr:lipase family protein [Agarivorans sp. B2Z047]MPW29309.1 lipase family protein [Agarivorans sp. B2Z047]UQN44896.1 lipase family protein [Agarivorans sp. B2Z047]